MGESGRSALSLAAVVLVLLLAGCASDRADRSDSTPRQQDRPLLLIPLIPPGDSEDPVLIEPPADPSEAPGWEREQEPRILWQLVSAQLPSSTAAGAALIC